MTSGLVVSYPFREPHRRPVTPLSPPQMRPGIALILHEAFQCGTMSHMLEERQKRLRRNELARFYHWKRRNQLAPLNLHKRLF